MSRWGALAPALLVVALLATWVRQANSVRVAAAPADGGRGAWFSADPDSHYHMRRLERALREGRVDPRDPLLAFPEYEDEGGAPIPWPGAYTRFLACLARPFAPPDGADGSDGAEGIEGAARARFVEHWVATWPLVFGVATALLAALAAGLLTGAPGTPGTPGTPGGIAIPVAALVAGTTHAFLLASVRYSHLGMGDHHAWVSMLHAGWLLVAGLTLGRGAGPGRGLVGGGVSGALAGLALGSWVATLAYLVLFQAALGWLVVRHARGRRPPRERWGLAAFGIAFHAAALAVVLPEVVASPWGPMAVVNLSWFHALELALGGLVFLPLPFLSGERPLGRYPWIVVAALGATALVLALTPAGSGVRQALAWASGRDEFMGTVSESQPLVGGVDGGLGTLVRWLGYGVLLLPLAWLAALRSGRDELLPWVVAVPFLVLAALAQRRFGDALAAPMAVLLGWGAGVGLGVGTRWWGGRVPGALWVALAMAVPIAANPARAAWTWRRTLERSSFREDAFTDADRLRRALAHWLRENGPRGGAVLAQWDLGHLIEWVARRPTVATGFGSYLGRDSYLDPWRFLLAEDEEEAEAILEGRRARHVVIAADWRRNRVSRARPRGPGGLGPGGLGPDGLGPGGLGPDGLGPDGLGPDGQPTAQGLEPTMAARLTTPHRAPPFLRLVHLERRGGWIYEHVPGARIQARGSPGERLEGTLEVGFPGSSEPLVWRGSAPVGPDGVARLRVPYATGTRNGDGAPRGGLRWSLGSRGGEVQVPEEAVLGGGTVLAR